MQLNTNFSTISLTFENGDSVVFLKGAILSINGEYISSEDENRFSKLEMVINKDSNQKYTHWSGETSKETVFERIINTPKHYNICQIGISYPLQESNYIHGTLPVEHSVGRRAYLNDSKCEFFLDKDNNLHINCYRIK